MKITDKMRLDWLLKPGHDLGIRDLRPGWAYGAVLFFDTRKAIDAAIRAQQKAGRKR